jgi:hypothetical protein
LTEHISQNNQRRQAKRIGNYINKKEYEALKRMGFIGRASSAG